MAPQDFTKISLLIQPTSILLQVSGKDISNPSDVSGINVQKTNLGTKICLWSEYLLQHLPASVGKTDLVQLGRGSWWFLLTWNVVHHFLSGSFRCMALSLQLSKAYTLSPTATVQASRASQQPCCAAQSWSEQGSQFSWKAFLTVQPTCYSPCTLH